VRRTIRLRPTFQERYDPEAGIGVRFTVAVDSAEGVDRRVFLCCARPRAGGLLPDVGDFHNVCTPPDLEDHPPGDPTPGADPPWFRVDALTLDFRSRAAAEETYASILADVRRLLRALDLMDRQAELPLVEIAEGNP